MILDVDSKNGVIPIMSTGKAEIPTTVRTKAKRKNKPAKPLSIEDYQKSLDPEMCEFERGWRTARHAYFLAALERQQQVRKKVKERDVLKAILTSFYTSDKVPADVKKKLEIICLAVGNRTIGELIGITPNTGIGATNQHTKFPHGP
jgi:hypothetical protein